MEDGSTGALVPAVKSGVGLTTSYDVLSESDAGKPVEIGEAPQTMTDKELLCPICMQIIRDAFLTACGHSFCYMCIVTHLDNKSDCPCCSSSLTINQLFPNFLLDKLIVKGFSVPTCSY